MLGNRNFRAATRAETPQFAAATAKQGQLEQQAMQQANALRSQNVLGAAQVYNKGMGDRTPIADFLGDTYNSAFGETPIDPAASMNLAGAPVDINNAEMTGELPMDDFSTGAEFDFTGEADTLAGADGGMSPMLDDIGVDTLPDMGVRGDLMDSINSFDATGEVIEGVGSEVAGDVIAEEVAGNVAGDALDAVGGLGGIGKIATAEDPAGEAAIQGALQAAQLVPGLGQAAMVANLLRTIV